MKLKKLIMIVLAAAMLLGVGAALSACGRNEEEPTYFVYFGLNDEDTGTQKVTTADAAVKIRKIITDNDMGYTEYVTYGAYVEKDVVYGNDTLVYSLTFTDKATVMKIVNEVKEELNLASVMIETRSASYEFVGAGEMK